jgi:hypothetical protein
VPHTTIPSHCFGRAELHTLISRADQLANQSKGELSANFRAIVAAAANLDGQLAGRQLNHRIAQISPRLGQAHIDRFQAL